MSVPLKSSFGEQRFTALVRSRAMDDRGESLIQAAQDGDVDNARRLLDEGVNIESKWMGKTPLLTAAYHDHAAIIKLLIERKADLNHQDSFGSTPLILACEWASADVTKLLLAAGADTSLRTNNGETAMYSACDGNQTETIALLDEWLGLSPAGREAKAAQWWPGHSTPLTISEWEAMPDRGEALRYALEKAAHAGNVDEARRLLDEGVDVDFTDPDRRTPLSYAAWKNHDALVKLLVEGRANLNHQDKDSWTPLIIACGHGSADVTKLLLAAGADTSLKDEEGMTAMDKARTHNKTECIALLDEWQGLSPAGCEAKVAQWWPELLAQKKRQELQQRAFRLGILQPLRDAGLESDETVAAAVRWCDDKAASNISELLKTGMVGELVAALKLKGIPAKKLEAAIQPTSGMAGMLSHRGSNDGRTDIPATVGNGSNVIFMSSRNMSNRTGEHHGDHQMRTPHPNYDESQQLNNSTKHDGAKKRRRRRRR